MKIPIYFAVLFMTCSFCQAKDRTSPGNIEELFVGFVRDYVKLRPETGTELGLPEGLGIPVRNDLLNDESEQSTDKEYQLFKTYRSALDTYEDAALSPSQKVAADVLKWFLDIMIEGEKYRYHRYVINHMLGFHNQLTTLMTEYHKIHNTKDARDYIARLKEYDRKMKQLIEQIKLRKDKGIYPPVYIIERCKEAIDNFIAVPYEENLLYTSFTSRCALVPSMSDTVKQELSNEVLEALEDVVYPAYRRMSVQLLIMKEESDERAGVWKLPDGDKYYEYCLRYHTTTTMTADQIHDLGLKEVQRIQEEITGLLKTLGIPDTGAFATKLITYGQRFGDVDDEHYFFPATEQGKAQTLQRYQEIIDSMTVRLPEMFAGMPKRPVRVERVPQYKEATAGTYYQPAPLDGSSPGTFYANLSYQHRKSDMQTLTYHEAVPGHHFQISLEQESAHTPLFKALFFFTGYAEGWALYAEKLAKEYGFYADVHSQLGNLRSELFRACRLVVDTGLHSKKWSRDKALQYMLENSGYGWYGEIDRYIVWPGQACAYKIGELTILALREKARTELGESFAIKEFHTTVLEYGSVPLEILEKRVDEYIDKCKEKAGN
jgi:uncharacterized protein (DUF885 family)